MYRTSWKAFFAVCGVAFLAIMAEGIVLSGRDLPPPPGAQPIVLSKGGVTAHKMSTKSWTLNYDHAQTTPDGSAAEIDGIHDGVFYRKGKPYIKISARHVSVNTITDDFTATGDVHVTQLKASLARSFDTDLILWTNSNKMLTMSHPSVIKTGDATMTVQTITVDLDKGTVHLGKIGGAVHVQ